MDSNGSKLCVGPVPGEGPVLLSVDGICPTAPIILISFGPFLPQRRRDVPWRFVFGGQELVELGGGLGCDDGRAAVTDVVLAVSHPVFRVCFRVTATAWNHREIRRLNGQTERKKFDRL